MKVGGKMNFKKLPLGVSPLIGRLHYGYPLSITVLNNDSRPWIYSNFIQMYCMEYLEEDNRERKNSEYYRFAKMDFDFFSVHMTHNSWMMNNPYINCKCINRDMLNSLSIDIIEFIISNIDREQYIYLFIDEFYINGQFHYMHNIMIHGYSLTKKFFYATGYKQGVFGEIILSFAEFLKSFYPDTNFLPYPYDMIYIMKLTNENTYVFNIEQVVRLLTSYLNSTDSGMDYSVVHHAGQFNQVRYTYGLNTYDRLGKLLSMAMDQDMDINIKSFFTLYEHKKLMRSRLNYLCELNFMVKAESMGYGEVLESSRVLKAQLLKYNISKNQSVLTRARGLLQEIFEKEQSLLNEVLVKI